MTTTRGADDPRLTPLWLRKELVAQGWTDRGIAAQLRAGLWARPRRGAYVDAGAWRATDDVGRYELTARAVLMQADTEVLLSHLSAAAVWDLSFWDLPLDRVHVTRADGRSGRADAGVNQHRGVLQDGDAEIRHGVPIVSATRLALELPAVTDLEHSLCFTNELLHRKETTQDALWARYKSMVTWPDSRANEVVLRLCSPKPESVGETRIAFLCWKQRLPAPKLQYEIRDSSGIVVARTDFAWPEYKVFGEFDGKVKYTRLRKEGESVTDVVLAEKAREELISELTGWVPIRFVWADLYRPEHTALRIRRILDRSRKAA